MGAITETTSNITEFAGQFKVAVVEATREEDTCAVCMDKKITHMCVPCTHFVMCGECAHKIDECPLCREKITSFITPIQK